MDKPRDSEASGSTRPAPDPSKPDWRPDTYWGTPASLWANIKGQARRHHILTAEKAGLLNDVPNHMLRDGIPQPAWVAAGALDPQLMGGESLPDYLPGEVEIARVVYASVLLDVTSIRARQRKRSILYRIVDDNDNVLSCHPKSSLKPLTLQRLVDMIESAEMLGADGTPSDKGEVGLVSIHWDWNLKSGSSPREAADFVSVSSEFYPGLGPWFRGEAAAWRAMQPEPPAHDDECDDECDCDTCCS